MKKLEINNENINYLFKDGEFYVALKPLCQALKLNYKYHHNQLKDDEILGPASRIYKTQVGGQMREMSFLPEKLIYGWLFQIRSASPQFLEYKQKCYEILYNFFAGQVFSRKKLLTMKAQIISDKNKLVVKLSTNQDFMTYLDLDKQHKSISQKINRIDNLEIQDNLSLFDNLV